MSRRHDKVTIRDVRLPPSTLFAGALRVESQGDALQQLGWRQPSRSLPNEHSRADIVALSRVARYCREMRCRWLKALTPLLRVASNIWVKDESRNPTGSFKARGMALAVSMAKQLGATALAAPSAGNAAYPTGGGTGLVGMWKAFGEMEQLGWIPAGKQPRFVSVQSAGCAPVAKAFLEGKERTEPWPNPQTHAYGLRVPSPVGGFICVRVLRESRGTAVMVSDEAADAATRLLAAMSGIDVCPEGGAAWSALQTLRERGDIGANDRVVVFNSGTGLKYR